MPYQFNADGDSDVNEVIIGKLSKSFFIQIKTLTENDAKLLFRRILTYKRAHECEREPLGFKLELEEETNTVTIVGKLFPVMEILKDRRLLPQIILDQIDGHGKAQEIIAGSQSYLEKDSISNEALVNIVEGHVEASLKEIKDPKVQEEFLEELNTRLQELRAGRGCATDADSSEIAKSPVALFGGV